MDRINFVRAQDNIPREFFAPSWKKAYRAFFLATSIPYIATLVVSHLLSSLPLYYGLTFPCLLLYFYAQIFSFLASLLLSSSKMTISERDITGFTFDGQAASVAWSSIHSVQLIRFSGLPSLPLLRVSWTDSDTDPRTKLTQEMRGTFYLSVYFDDPSKFWNAVDRNAPLNNPIRRYMHLSRA